MVDFSFNIGGLSNAAPSQVSGSRGGAQGVFMGKEALVLDDPMSLLSDAAEELSFAVDTTDDFELLERKEKAKITMHDNRQMLKYVSAMQQTGKAEALQQCLASVRSAVTKEEVLRLVRQQFQDPSDAYGALAFMEHELEQEHAEHSTLYQLLGDAQADLLHAEASTIRAGVQAGIAAQDYRQLGSTDVLRDSYRRIVFDLTSATAAFDYVLATFGNVHFDDAVRFLLQSLGADMGAQSSSMDKQHLEFVNTNLGAVRLMQSAYVLCDDLMQRWHEVHKVAVCPLDSKNLLAQVLALGKETYLGAHSIEQIAKQANAPDVSGEVMFLQELMRAARSFPPQLFGDMAGRMKVLDAVQAAVDQAIEREDAALAAEAGGS